MTTALDALALRAALRRRHRLAEDEALLEILPDARLTDDERKRAETLARGWISAIRSQKVVVGSVADFLQEYNLSTQEGVALMCVAEALLRIPDTQTADDLIKDKLAAVDWAAHEKRTGTLFANASIWGLMLTGKALRFDETEEGLKGTLSGLMARASQPVIRSAMSKAMGLLGDQFVMGRTIGEALDRGAEAAQKGYRASYDMLGEGARTEADAQRYFEAYINAIRAIGRAQEKGQTDLWASPSISVKLSALHPRFSEAQRDRCFPVLVERLTLLAEEAAAAAIPLTVDAEESERLELWFDIVVAVLQSPVTLHWEGLGVAVQAYQKRAPQLIDMFATECQQHKRHMMIRLVKGAYWDSEIKRTQMGGFTDYPVYTRKTATDVSYLACARKLLSYNHLIFAAFGTHNAYTMASIVAIAAKGQRFEFQRLQGMGGELHDQAVALGYTSRIYAPVGSHQDLLAYLVRRILENGANSSFVHKLRDETVPISALVHDPEVELKAYHPLRNPRLPLPQDLFVDEPRRNSTGVDLDSIVERDSFAAEVQSHLPLTADMPQDIALDAIDILMQKAAAAQPLWRDHGLAARAHNLEVMADLLELYRARFVALIVSEAGRTVKNALAEVREAVDLCRFYAVSARKSLAPVKLAGYTGEQNWLSAEPRGVVVAISPWNFPLAIFLGQIVAALVAGNAVIAKPAEQTPRIAAAAIALLHQAGVPRDVVALACGRGETVGAALIRHPRTAAVVFTGSTEVGQMIQKSLNESHAALIPLVAETGGLNCMIVDSTALPEQVIDDVVLSAFDSAGQRCSSLRVLFLQDDIADKMIAMLQGALDVWRLGDPLDLSTDMGALIDSDAKAALEEHIQALKQDARAKLLYQGRLPDGYTGTMVAPHVFQIEQLSQLQKEAFGPVLHIIRWQRDQLDDVLASIQASRYGLTAGIHSRRDGFVRYCAAKLHVGNIYVNRNIIGAIPNVQPFGGCGLSGTGPKAGGAEYVKRFTTEKVITTDTTAAGGNASLMTEI